MIGGVIPVYTHIMEDQVNLVRQRLDAVKAVLTKTLMEAYDIIENAPFADGIAERIHTNRKGVEKFMEAKIDLSAELNNTRARIYNIFQPYLSALILFEWNPNEVDSEGSDIETGSEGEAEPIPVVIGNRAE